MKNCTLLQFQNNGLDFELELLSNTPAIIKKICFPYQSWTLPIPVSKRSWTAAIKNRVLVMERVSERHQLMGLCACVMLNSSEFIAKYQIGVTKSGNG